MRIRLSPILFALVVLLLGAMWSLMLGADLPLATPAATAADYLAHPAQATTAGQAAADSLNGMVIQPDWKHLLEGGAMVLLSALLAVATRIPIGGPYGTLINGILGVVAGIFKPAVDRKAEAALVAHSDAFQTLVSTIQTLSNNQTVQQLKDRLLKNADPAVRATIDALVSQLEAQGIDHPPTPVVSITPPPIAKTA